MDFHGLLIIVLRLPEGLLSWCPLHWTEVTTLKRLHDAKHFLHGAANGAGADQGVLHDAFWVDDEESAFCETILLVEDLVVARDLVRVVSKDRILYLCKIALKPSLVAPFRIRRGGKHLTVQCLEFSFVLRESLQFRWADEGKIAWVEEEHEPLAFVVREADLFKITLMVRRNICERRCFDANLNHSEERLFFSSVVKSARLCPVEVFPPFSDVGFAIGTVIDEISVFVDIEHEHGHTSPDAALVVRIRSVCA